MWHFQVDISNLEMILCWVGQVKNVVKITATIISKGSYGDVLPLPLNREGIEVRYISYSQTVKVNTLDEERP